MRVVEAPEPDDAIGINDRVALAVAEERMRRRIVEDHLRNGVTIVDPATTRIDASVEIGQDARIEPWSILEGSTVIAQDAVIGPNAHLRDSRIGPRTHVWASVIEESTVAEDVEIGPFAHLRPGPRSARAAASATSPRSRRADSGQAPSSITSATSATPRSGRT